MRHIVERLKAHWLALGFKLPPGATSEELRAFEARYNVRLPADMRAYFAAVNGTNYEWGEDLIAFWSIDRVKSVGEVYASYTNHDYKIERADEYFIFADHSISVFDYAIRLSNHASESNRVVRFCLPAASGGYGPVSRDLAGTFSEFAELYLKDPWQLMW